MGAHARTTKRAGRRALTTERDAARRAAALADALATADCETDAIAATVRAADEILGTATAQMMLRDEGSDTLHLVAPDDGTTTRSCPVASAGACRAMQHGGIEHCVSSDALDACPQLARRDEQPIGAVCIPLAVAGRVVGVLHTTLAPQATVGAEQLVELDRATARCGARIGQLRVVARATEQAATDPLTGAANRRTLETRVRQLLDERAAFALVVADVDRFKQINDSHGHETGDHTLRALADAMRRSLRPDDIVARIGGDEFVMVITSCAADQAAKVTERVRAEFARTLGAARLGTATASFGIADDSAGASLASIMTAADEALLDAKRAGRNRMVVVPTAAVIDLSEPSDIRD